MYDAVHSMRTRIVTSKSFRGDKIIGAILFENTAFDRTIDGIPTPNYLWNQKGIVPFLKVDVGLEADILDGVQLMKPIPNLNALLHRAKKAGIFGTKMRSVIKHANEKGIRAIAEQQFTLGKQIIQSGLIPTLEPEVDIHSTDKVQCEEMLKSCLLEQLATLTKMDKIILKLSIPTVSNYYLDLIEQYPDQVICIVALSGGYPRAVANELLSQQRRMIASFSRALTENLQYSITDNEFDERLQDTIDSIYQASKAG